MNVYVDTSVLLRVVLAQPEPLPEWLNIARPVSSELIRVECLRTVDRARFRGNLTDTHVAELRGRIFEHLAGFELIALDRWVLGRAEDPFPTALSTLDAVHLASALLARARIDDLKIATHDEELAQAARATDFEVYGV